MNQQEKQKIINKLNRWYELLGISGANTKQMVRNDIQEVLSNLDKNIKANKKYRIEFKSPYLGMHKHPIHYTDRLYLYLNEIKGRFNYYPENNFPLEIYNNQTNELIVRLNNLDEFRKYLFELKEQL